MSIQINVTGNLGREAEVKETRNGKTYTVFSIGHTPREKRDGEWTDGETIWFRVTYWGELPAVMLGTGTSVTVTGELKQESYDKDGVTRTSLAITAQTVGLIIKPVRAPSAANSFSPAPADHGYLPAGDDTPF
jgi:single-strand DNA-binding protein